MSLAPMRWRSRSRTTYGHGLAEYYHQVDTMQRELDWMTKYTLGSQKIVP